MQECILDNFWYQYNHKKKDKKGYVLSILNSLAEYLNMMSGKMPSSQNIEVLELEPIYILYTRNAPEIYASLKKYW
jgi:flagellar basal body rod protein FlgC